MSRTDRRPTTPTERAQREQAQQDKLAALHHRLDEQVAALRDSKDWQAWLDVAARLHGYSFNNVLLIRAQRPDATVVAGYQTWRSLGRQVDKGELGIQILAPIRRRAAPEHDRANAEDSDVDPTHTAPTARATRVAGYRITHVWDVAQTSGEPLPEQPRPQLLHGEAPDGLWDRLAALVAAEGYRLERGPCRGVNGWTDFLTRTVRVRDDVEDAQAVKTLAHELSHVRLHDVTDFDGALTRRCRGVEEVEAESVAYLITASHGMDTGDYTFPYIATWASRTRGTTPGDAVRATGTRVMTAARSWLSQLQPEQPTASADAALNERVETARARTAKLPEQAVALADAAERSAGQVPRADLVAVHAEATQFFHDHLDGSWVPDYLQGRSLLPAVQEPWIAGYAPNTWTSLTDHLRSLGWDEAVIEASGLARRARTGHLIDHFRDRLVLPIRDPAGDVAAFIGRARPGAPDRVPKYLNSPETTIYHKHQTLYGLTEGRHHLASGAIPVLVEGPLDAIAVTDATAGRCTGMTPCGTALTQTQAAQLAAHADLSTRPIVVATDNDPAGNAAAIAAYDLLAPFTRHLMRADFTGGSDPADHMHRYGPSALLPALTDWARPLVNDVLEARIERWLPRLQWVEGRVGAVRDVAPVLARLAEPQRHDHIKGVADRLGVDVDTVEQEVDAATRRSHETAQAVPVGRSGALPQRASPTPAAIQVGQPLAGCSSTALPRPQAVHSRRTR